MAKLDEAIAKARKAGESHYRLRLSHEGVAFDPAEACPFDPVAEAEERAAWLEGHDAAKDAVAELEASLASGTNHVRGAGEGAGLKDGAS